MKGVADVLFPVSHEHLDKKDMVLADSDATEEDEILKVVEFL